MIKVLELFAGIGACSKALTNLGIEHEIVDAVEIDRYAIESFNVIHGTSFEPQDITKWDKDIECDLIMHGSPCQDFSLAGEQAGGDEGSGTRSSLMYETLRIVEKLKPKYVIWENVRNILSPKHRKNFDKYCDKMKSLGYKNFAEVLNAKNYGIPQNRERVFTVSILVDDDDPKFSFPEKIKLKKKLKDLLEDKVSESFFLPDEQAKRLKVKEKDVSNTIRVGGRGSIDRHAWDIIKVGDLDIKGQDNIKRVYSGEGISPTLSTMQGGNRQPKVAIKTANSLGYDLAENGDGIDIFYPDSDTRRGRVGHGVSKTIATCANQGVVDKMRIRKLTPKECWRLMGFSDEDYDKAVKKGMSKTQLYKQAGNSIVVNVLEAIFKELL